MAIYHCTCKIISRGKGRSAVGSAAYRSGEKLKNEYDGIEHDYTKKGGVVYSEVMLCENAPKEYKDIEWNKQHEHIAKIERMLGIFKGREKKELQNKIDNFERLRRSNLDKLGALGCVRTVQGR